MSRFTSDPKTFVAGGFAALRRGAPQEAIGAFRRAISAGLGDADVWFGLAGAQRSLGARDEELAALDQALNRDTRHMPSLIAKGDWYARAGDVRAADSYYAAALKLGALINAPPPELRRQLERIEAARQQYRQDYEAHLTSALTREGLGAPGAERFAHALDLLLGRREVFVQQPRHFYFPELPQVQFYERERFDWAPALESATPDIVEELRAVVANPAGVAPYMETTPDRPRFNTNGLENNPDWSAFFLIKNGVEVEENTRRCPRTMAALRHVPLCRIDGRTPSVLFSLLKPGTKIPPHNGFMNARLICHLPLIVPPDCALRVGNETRTWTEGRVVSFDDSIEHEAWNYSSELRSVLIFDVWKPELTEQERRLVSTMLSAINDYQGRGGEWVE